jgi:hypothetical protein
MNSSSIAEGNPDEDKIGAFGVGKSFILRLIEHTSHNSSIGFYSLFSITEEPFVTSGSMPSTSQTEHLFIDFCRPMDGFPLEEGPST